MPLDQEQNEQKKQNQKQTNTNLGPKHAQNSLRPLFMLLLLWGREMNPKLIHENAWGTKASFPQICPLK